MRTFVVILALVALLARFSAGVVAPAGDLRFCLWTGTACDAATSPCGHHHDKTSEEAGEKGQCPDSERPAEDGPTWGSECPHTVQISDLPQLQNRVAVENPIKIAASIDFDAVASLWMAWDRPGGFARAGVAAAPPRGMRAVARSIVLQV